MKTILHTTILAFAFLVASLHSSAEGTDTASLNANSNPMSTICNFAFKIDLNQIIKEAENTDLTDLSDPSPKASKIAQSAVLPFAFKPDTNLILSEAQESDGSELDTQ